MQVLNEQIQGQSTFQREYTMYDQKLQNRKTFDISRQCVFGCRESQRKCGRRLWTGSHGGLRGKDFMLA